MCECRNDDRGCPYFAVGGDELLDGSESTAAKFSSHSIGPRQVGIHDANQPDCTALLGELVIDPRVVAPEGADTNDGYVNNGVNRQMSIPHTPAAAEFQRNFFSNAICPA